jgi:hypothetical protein
VNRLSELREGNLWKSIKPIARNQYKALLQQMSFEAVYKIAWEEHNIRSKMSTPKAELIEKILTQKYGKE